jgi:hypothetical protein
VTAQTVKKVMQQRLTRGAPVLIADSFGQAALRGAKRIIASKGPVKCNKGGRCAGVWCVGLAVFVADPKTMNEDKEMGWRGGTTKVCITHLKDDHGVLVLPPAALQHQPVRRLPGIPSRTGDIAPVPNGNGNSFSVVTWDDLAKAHQDGDINRLALMARKLKADNEQLKGKVIEAQDRLIRSLTPR